MKFLFILPFIATSLFGEMHKARVTYYWKGKITSTGSKPVAGKTIAVDPKIIPYGSKIFIPKMNKTFIAMDTGPDIVKKKASKGKAIVVDIYCSSKAEAQEYIKKYPMYMEINVEKK